MTVHDLTTDLSRRPVRPVDPPLGPPAPNGPRTRPPQAQVMELSTGYWKTQVTYVLAELGVADLLADAPAPADDLAGRVGCAADPLRRLLRAGAGLGLFATDGDGRFRLTDLGQCLRSDVPQSVRSLVLLAGAEHYVTWGHLLDCVRSGRPQLQAALGADSWWGYLHDHPERSELFDRAMAELSRSSQTRALQPYDFGRVRRLVDVGGGTGTLLAQVLTAHPGLTGVLFDRPEVVANAGPVLGDLTGRCEVVGGDMFAAVPAGGDAYLLCSLLHDHNDAAARRILTNIRAAMEPGGTLLLVETVLPDDDSPHLAKLNDLNMMVMIDGRERTHDELSALLADTGFRLEPSRPSPSPAQLLVAHRI
ncbi:MAG: methyltransferase [Propionibacteriaceae bacterium]